MKLSEALEIIDDKPKGFMVSFECKLGRILTSDYFPDKHAGEPLIETEAEAWELARSFAEKTKGKYINIYVINHEFSPVPGYESKKIENREHAHDRQAQRSPYQCAG